jgi:hypothetical protein
LSYLATGSVYKSTWRGEFNSKYRIDCLYWTSDFAKEVNNAESLVSAHPAVVTFEIGIRTKPTSASPTHSFIEMGLVYIRRRLVWNVWGK